MHRILKQSFFRFFFFFLLVLFPVIINGQPSFHVDFFFKLYDNNGEQVDYELFCKDYKLLGELNRNDQTPCTNKNILKSAFYNDSSKIFNASGSIVYNDLVRKFIHQKDTMTLILYTKMDKCCNGVFEFKIDSLVMKHGVYFIKDNSLSYVDFEKSEVDYYNYILDWAKRNKKDFSNYNDMASYREINRLRRKYNIDLNDYEEKSIEDIFR